VCLFHEPYAGAEDPVQVPWRPAGGWVGFPRRLKEATFAQPDQDRVQRAGLQAQLFAQVIAVPGNPRVTSQNVKYRKGLR